MVKAFVVNGLGIGCHEEVAHAYKLAGAEAEVVHMNELLKGRRSVFDAQILNFSGGFLQGDKFGAGMCAANEIEHAVVGDDRRKLKDILLEFVGKGGVIYGQCNGFQLQVKLGLLPGIGGDYSQQTVTLTHNTGGVYRVGPVMHKVEMEHFAFKDLAYVSMWCRHGEGRLLFHSKYGSVPEDLGEERRRKVNDSHVLLRYANPETREPTEEFPHNPNGSVDGIAGLVDPTGRIIGHMGHTEVGIYLSRSPIFFYCKDADRRLGIKAGDLDEKWMEDQALTLFRNIVNYFK
jgi:phosphoribosylformylglycinamidine (FGAM) synthase-like amidotransferase family enzyme